MKAEAYVMREGGGFVDFVEGKETHPLVEPLRVLKEDSYRRQIDDFITQFWINIKTLVSQASSEYIASGLQLGVVRKKLGVVQKFNVVRTSNLTSDHTQLWTTLSPYIYNAYTI
jgi:hypothetical protein